MFYDVIVIGAGAAGLVAAAEAASRGRRTLLIEKNRRPGVKILMSGGTLADASGVTVGSGATLTGAGTVSANLSGAGTITAKSGTLLLSGTVNSGPTLTIDSAAAADLKFTGTATIC